MQSLALPPGPLALLCLGAHADDIEIGCGGTILRLLAERPGSTFRWVVMSGAGTPREAEARKSASWFLAGSEFHLDVHDLRDGHLPAQLTALKERLEGVREVFRPTLVLTHTRDDRHQDHRAVSDVTWQTFRDHLVLEYEIPKYDGDLGSPNVFVPLSADTVARKADHLLAAFTSQGERRWFTRDTFFALARMRGIECAAPEGYAEAYHGRKVLLAS